MSERYVRDSIVRAPGEVFEDALEQKPHAFIPSLTAAENLAIAEYAQSLTPPGVKTDAALLIREDRDR